jgi:hypothetical protein
VERVRRGGGVDCTRQLPEIWPTLPIGRYVDATVFSVSFFTQEADSA